MIWLMTALLGLIMVLISWIAGYVLLKKNSKPGLKSISRHAANSPYAIKGFIVVLVGCGGVFYGWLAMWLAPRLGLGLGFTVTLVLAFVLQCLTAFIPDIAGWRRSVHKAAAWSMAVLFLAIVLMLLSSEISKAAWLIVLICASYMGGGFIALAVSQRARQHFLSLQIMYVVALQLAVLGAAYL